MQQHLKGGNKIDLEPQELFDSVLDEEVLF